MPSPRSRPAETAGGLGAVATAIALAVGLSTEWVGAIGITAGLVPAAVTYLVNHGGVRGVAASIWRGRP